MQSATSGGRRRRATYFRSFVTGMGLKKVVVAGDGVERCSWGSPVFKAAVDLKISLGTGPAF